LHSAPQGKTIQLIALLAALMEKKGTGQDLLDLDRRTEIGRRNMRRIQQEKDHASRQGRMAPQDFSQLDLEPNKLPTWAPVLLVVPGAVIDHWRTDISRWGHFSVAARRSGGPPLAPMIESIQMGILEVLICPHSLFQMDKTLLELKRVEWKLIVVDELHFAKNWLTMLSKNFRKLKDNQRECRVIGMSFICFFGEWAT
jgi:SNF2 family DNA or RNA helicase